MQVSGYKIVCVLLLALVLGCIDKIIIKVLGGQANLLAVIKDLVKLRKRN